MNSFLPYLILSCMFYKTVVMQVSISADITQIIIGGANVTLTCNLPSFSVPALWVNNITSGTLTVCRNTGICSPQSFGRYIYSASSSTIVAKISEFDNSTDNFGWKCQYSSYSDVFIFNFTNTISSTRDIQNSTRNLTAGEIAGIVLGVIFGLLILVLVGRVIYVYCIQDKEEVRFAVGNPENSQGKIDVGVFAIVIAVVMKILICDFCKRGDKKKENSEEGDPGTGSKPVIMKILMCDFCTRSNRIDDKKKGGGDPGTGLNTGRPEGENGNESRKPEEGNGHQKITTKSKKGESESNYPLMKPNKIGHQDEVNHESVQVKTFDKNERRPLPLNPADNDGNKRGTSANFNDKQGLANDTPQAPKLAPIDPKLLTTVQGADTSEKPRKKKKRKKNKKTDEIKSTDDLAE